MIRDCVADVAGDVEELVKGNVARGEDCLQYLQQREGESRAGTATYLPTRDISALWRMATQRFPIMRRRRGASRARGAIEVRRSSAEPDGSKT
eukprot:3457202-Pyramimonas_sp.AAC.1